MSNKVTTYKGWLIDYNANAPITGKFRAVKMGVSICGNTKALLMRMIDQKESVSCSR